MASYSVEIKPAAVKELEALPQKTRRLIVKKILALADQPRPHGAEKLTGEELYRIRQGDYRVLYEIHDQKLTVLIVRVGNRREVYR